MRYLFSHFFVFSAIHRNGHVPKSKPVEAEDVSMNKSIRPLLDKGYKVCSSKPVWYTFFFFVFFCLW